MYDMPSRTGAVHVATTKRRYKGRLYTTHLLRRTYRDGKRVRHETLGNISHLPDPLVDIVRRSLAGESFVPSSESIAIVASRPHGHVEAVLEVIRNLELNSVISAKRCRERDLVLGMIAQRVLEPGSKLAGTRQWNTTTLGEELGIRDADVDEVYSALDWLLARQSSIEKKLARRHLTEGGLILYDVSSSFYYGHNCSLAQFGHSRDGKRGFPIIVYGVLTNREGCPVATEVYAGNTADPKTVTDQVDKIRNRFGLERVVLVGDRGMLTQPKITAIREHPGLGWISALRSGQIAELVEQKRIQMSLFDEQHLAEIASPDFPGERLVACFNPLLADERRRTRRELLEATEKDLGKVANQVSRRKLHPLTGEEIGIKVGRVLGRFKMAKHFQYTIGDGSFEWKRNGDSIRREEQLDGLYVIRTSEPAGSLTAPDAVRSYKSLANVERAFRCLKSVDLMIRPIRHRVEDHVRAHVFVSVLAYYVHWHMRKRLAPLLFEDENLDELRLTRDPVAPAQASSAARRKKVERRSSDDLPLHSFKTLLDDLATRSRNTCRLGSDPNAHCFHQTTEATPLQQRAFELLRA